MARVMERGKERAEGWAKQRVNPEAKE